VRIKSFKYKLIFSYVVIILISFSLIAFFLDRYFEENSVQDLKQSLVNQAALIENQLFPQNLKTDNTVYLERLVKDLSPRIRARITIIDRQGRVLADSEESAEGVLRMENHANRPEVKSALNGMAGEEIRHSATLNLDMLYVALPIRDVNGIIGVLRLALPLANVQKILFTIRKTILLALFLALVLAFVLGSVMAQETIKPIKRMIQIARRFSQGEFGSRIFPIPKDEIGELADTFNKMAQDIEDKIKEIKSQNQQLGAILSSMIEGVIVVGKSSRIISVNPTIEKIFGVSNAEVSGKFFLEAIRNNDISELIKEVVSKRQFISKELDLAWPVQKIFQINASPIFEKDAVSGCLVVIHDITEIRKLETMRRDFVANVSHELKTPLTSIKGFVETLMEGAWEDKENSGHFLRIIQDHTNRLNSLISDLLELSYLESREIKLELKEINLKGLLDEVLSGFKSQLNKKSIEVKNELPDSLLVKADKDRVEQVFTNLLDNAIKFNQEKGSIKIQSREINGKVKITVEDSGIGIPAKDIPRIFERFYRVDKARSRELGGTGLGLSIVKHIVELHGGSVGVESTEGLGSTFWFILPK
jgi:two-component system, OmpR family, phosphate regulon sensor histidine kinase PhoR